MLRPIGKKGDVSDPLIILIAITFLAITFIVTIFANTKIKNIIDDTALNQSQAYSSISNAFERVNTTGVQKGFTVMFGIMCIFTIASSFLVRVHPVFLFLYIIFLAVTIFVAVFLGNLYVRLEDNAILGEIIAQQGMISIIMENITKIMLGVGALSMVIVFSKLSAPSVNSGGEGI